MGHASFKVSAPGSLMLMGEHAVLNGSRCIVCAVNRRISIACSAINDRKIEIQSKLGAFESPLDNPEPESPFQFAVMAVAHLKDALPGGISLKIESDIPETVGLASSAAVTVASCGAARRLAGLDCSPELVLDASISVVQSVQGRASGADVAAAALGGVLGYRMEPREIFRIEKTFPLALVYSGYKRPTPEVIEIVETRRQQFPEEFNVLYELVHSTVTEALQAIEIEDWRRLGTLMNFNHGLMDAMGVNNADLAKIVFALRRCADIEGAKISGAGLGDCVVGLGKPNSSDLGGELINVELTTKGLTFE